MLYTAIDKFAIHILPQFYRFENLLYIFQNFSLFLLLVQLVFHKDAYRERSKCIPISAHCGCNVMTVQCLCDLCTSLFVSVVVYQGVVFK